MSLESFHPITAQWFRKRFSQPTEPQRLGWPEIHQGRHTLIAAPTGSGKTLTAFLSCIDGLLREALSGELPDETRVVYVSPLKALSNDIRRNLEEPLSGIEEVALAQGEPPPAIRAAVRTGDTPQSQRQAMLRKPPHILVTTPESLYLLLTAPKSREMLRGVRTVIVDEIHALVRDRRGTHLALSLERLEGLCRTPPVRIGLSATVKPIEQVVAFLLGSRRKPGETFGGCKVIDVGHQRDLDLAIEVPESDLSAVCSLETWQEIYGRLADLIQQHRSTLVFVNTRRMAERVSHTLGELLGEEAVASHHGSLSRDTRLRAEERLKAGELKAIVATASLELGIDIGAIDLVCQIGSPRSIATFLQRVGRSGHSLGLVPKGRLFALTREELMEALALCRAIGEGRLDQVVIPPGSLDVLAQQIVAAVACDEWGEEELFQMIRGAWPYRNLVRSDFDAVVEMLSEGIRKGGRRNAYLHRDEVNHRLRPRRGARIAASTSGGAIPENADYRVVTGEGTYVGTINEDFAIESMSGDIFLLGNTSWRIRHVRGGQVVVDDAAGAPASIPFWLGEAPARTPELSREISLLRRELERRVWPTPELAADPVATERALAAGVAWLGEACGAKGAAALQASRYVQAQCAAVGLVPTADRILFERFFDETGSQQLVIHAPFGGRINRAWGLALRKRFCRSFDFELQATADDNGIALALGPDQSFPLETVFGMLRSSTAEAILTQAVLAVPMFTTRWRWNATRALAVLRHERGSKVPPPLQRFRADDLLALVFPQQVACQENVVGDIEIPDHPLVKQTIDDCLHEATDLDGWIEILQKIESGQVELVARDTREPSPFSHELLNARPYAFLDDAPLEERRARAVATRRTLEITANSDLCRLDPLAIERVRSEAQPLVRNADELHDALLLLGALPEQDWGEWRHWFEELLESGRATVGRREGRPPLWIAAERWELALAGLPGLTAHPPLSSLGRDGNHTSAEAGVELVRGRLECQGPVTAESIAAALGLEISRVESCLTALEGEGFVMRGQFTGDGAATEWCERRLLARIHRITLENLRRRIEPVELEHYVRFLLEHHHLASHGRISGRDALLMAIEQLQGFELPAGAWEQDILSARVPDYRPSWMDDLALSGCVAWGRLQRPRRLDSSSAASGPLTRVVPISLVLREDLPWLLPPEPDEDMSALRAGARKVLEALDERGALFQDELRSATGLLPAQLDEALSELAALGRVSADGFSAIRALVSPGRRRVEEARRRWRRSGRAVGPAVTRGGRWSRFPATNPEGAPSREERAERWAGLLLHRYGVVWRDLLIRETVAPPWRDLLAAYRRMEARGEIRGGRFVRQAAGEQYAGPEAVDRLRRVRDRPVTGQGDQLVLAASDPVNLAGILTEGPRVPAVRTNRILLQGGKLIASLQSAKVHFHQELPDQEARLMERLLVGK